MMMNPVIMPPTGNDQAAALRELVQDRKDSAPVRINGMKSIAVLSGKGGVGKSNMTVNIALALADLGARVAVLDADLGLANIDILFGVIPKYNLGHFLRGEKDLSEIIFKVNDRVSIIPGGAGIQELADLDPQQHAWMMSKLSFLEDDFDFLLLDTSAGIHKNVISFAMASDLSMLLTTPEPTAIRDAYSILKSLCQVTGGRINIGLVVNMTSDEKEGTSVADRIVSAADQFLGYKVSYMGCVFWDAALRESVKKRKPLLLGPGDSASVPCFRAIAKNIFDIHGGRGAEARDENTFLHRLLNQMRGKGIQ